MFKQLSQFIANYQMVIAYLFFGGLTTLINFIVFFLTAVVGHWNYQLGNVLAWFLSVLFAYLTNRVWVFQSQRRSPLAVLKEAVVFFTVRGATLIADVLIMYVGISLLHQNELLVKLADQIIVIVANYFFSKWFVFRQEPVHLLDDHSS